MTPASRAGAVSVPALLLAAAPFAVALVAAVGPRHDLRWLCMALAAAAGTALVLVGGSARRRPVAAALALAAFAAATLLAASVAFLLGARAMPGVLGVATLLAVCFTASGVLAARARSA